MMAKLRVSCRSCMSDRSNDPFSTHGRIAPGGKLSISGPPESGRQLVTKSSPMGGLPCLANHPIGVQRFQDALQEDHDGTFQEYIGKMAQGTSLGDLMSLIALAEIYGVRIKVHTLGRVLSKVVHEVDGRGEGQQRGLTILRGSRGECHYDWLQPAPKPEEPPAPTAPLRIVVKSPAVGTAYKRKAEVLDDPSASGKARGKAQAGGKAKAKSRNAAFGPPPGFSGNGKRCTTKLVCPEERLQPDLKQRFLDKAMKPLADGGALPVPIVLVTAERHWDTMRKMVSFLVGHGYTDPSTRVRSMPMLLVKACILMRILLVYGIYAHPGGEGRGRKGRCADAPASGAHSKELALTQAWLREGLAPT